MKIPGASNSSWALLPRVAGAWLLLLLFSASAAGQEGRTPDAAEDIDRAWTCPMHREITEDRPGQCSLCDMDLVETRIREAWSCSVHTVIVEAQSGQCPICQRDLYPITQELAYSCPMHPGVQELHEGKCPVCGMDLEVETSLRPHQDHNPKHGGIFFMAPDAWHHLEGTYPEPGVFRVYFFDNFSQPMESKGFRGRAVLKERFDPKTKETRELVAYPLVSAPDGSYMEARVGEGGLPREIVARIQFDPDGEHERFDFIFADLSRETDGQADTTDGALPGSELVIPERPEEIVLLIDGLDSRLQLLIGQGEFAKLYVPALDAKELGLALESHGESLPLQRRRDLKWTVKQLVRGAWLLDDYGDMGNKQDINAAYDLFHGAVRELKAIYNVP